MTVITKTNSDYAVVKNNAAVFYLNIVLAAMIFANLAAYVILSNKVVSANFSVRLLKEKLNKLNNDIDLNTAELENKYNIQTLTEFAQKHGLVEVTEANQVLSNSDVAIKKQAISH